MAFLTDNLLGVLLAGGLVLMLAIVTLRQQDEAGTITNRRSVSGRTASLAMVIRSDFENIAAFQSHTDSTISLTVTTDPATMAQATVSYHRRRRIVSGDTLYDVERTEDAATTVIGSGLVDWAIQPRDASGSPSPVASADRATVRFVMNPAFVVTADTLDAVWERTFTPPLLGGMQF